MTMNAPAHAVSDERAVKTYQAAVRNNFSFLKATDRVDELFTRSIPLEDGRGYLVPVCELHSDDGALIARLADWRAANQTAFPTQFPVTIEGTTSWLRSRLLNVEDRILFLVLDHHGKPVGHLGYANCLNDSCEMEIDNVVRGVTDTAPGIMSHAMQAVLDWAEEFVAPHEIHLRVFSDNEHAIEFYRRLGFINGDLLPLRRHEAGASVSFEPLSDGDEAKPDTHFLRMIYRPDRKVDGSKMILTAGPSISAREASYALDAARYGWNHQWSKYIKRFEQQFADYIGVKYALSTSSCTGALHVALTALGIGPGDEVIVPDLTWVATANAVAYVGATPVFADVQPDTWCLDPASFESLITERTRAVIPVHLYGHPAQMGPIMQIARRHKLRIIEDAAPAIGAEYEGQRVGTFGDFATFSFQGAKLLVTGEGGMLVTDDDTLYARARSIWDQGRDVQRTFWINEAGLKYKMSNIQASIGLAQLERVEEMIEAKRRLFSWYAEGLAGAPHLSISHEAQWARSIYWMTNIMLDERAGLSRDDLIKCLRARNIDTRPVFPAISQYPVWPKRSQPQPIARRVGDRGLNLPSGVRLKREQVDYICRAVIESLGGSRSVEKRRGPIQKVERQNE